MTDCWFCRNEEKAETRAASDWLLDFAGTRKKQRLERQVTDCWILPGRGERNASWTACFPRWRRRGWACSRCRCWRWGAARCRGTACWPCRSVSGPPAPCTPAGSCWSRCAEVARGCAVGIKGANVTTTAHPMTTSVWTYFTWGTGGGCGFLEHQRDSSPPHPTTRPLLRWRWMEEGRQTVDSQRRNGRHI